MGPGPVLSGAGGVVSLGVAEASFSCFSPRYSNPIVKYLWLSASRVMHRAHTCPCCRVSEGRLCSRPSRRPESCPTSRPQTAPVLPLSEWVISPALEPHINEAGLFAHELSAICMHGIGKSPGTFQEGGPGALWAAQPLPAVGEVGGQIWPVPHPPRSTQNL